MNVWEIMLLSAALSADSFGIGASFAVRGIKMPVISAIVICLISVAATAAAVAGGEMAGNFIPTGSGNFIGAVMLVCLGLYVIFGGKNKKSEHQNEKGLERTARILTSPESGDKDHSKSIEWKEACWIGTALSLDSMAAGFGAGISGGGMTVPLMCGVFQLIFLKCGELTAKTLKKEKTFNERYLTIISGIILMTTAAGKIFF